jgi:hypothetical protein
MEDKLSMSRLSRWLLLALVIALPFAGCKKKEEANEPETFAFIIYPGSRYLAQLSETTKQAHKVIKPNEEPPMTAIYDTDAPVEKVAEYYAKEMGYPTIAPDATNNMSSAKPPAYWRSGDLNTDAMAVKSIADQMKLNVDYAKAQGKYKAAEIEPKPNRPRITVQRPYFDMTTSQTVDRTLILMSRS